MRKKEFQYQLLFNTVMAAFSLLILLPLVLLFVSSFTDNNEIILKGYSFFPKQLSLSAYAYIWKERAQIFSAYFVTIAVTAVGTSIGLIISIMYAYALSKPYFFGKRFFSLYILFTMLFNGGLVPTYIMYTRYLHMKNTPFALVIPALLMNAFNVLLIRSYFINNVPASLVEAAKIDGATEWQTLLKVVIPVSKPIIVTIGLFIGLAYWNDWQNGLYYITKPELYSVQQILNNMLRNIEYLTKNSSAAQKSTTLAGTLPASTVRMA
ncbi:MAG: carbohydrate ABC transporter permease, partial [Lachnospiraceae bacterium]|nr:carbohydrate ABC transporter permease [Lachnospiraceae bacterium]